MGNKAGRCIGNARIWCSLTTGEETEVSQTGRRGGGCWLCRGREWEESSESHGTEQILRWRQGREELWHIRVPTLPWPLAGCVQAPVGSGQALAQWSRGFFADLSPGRAGLSSQWREHHGQTEQPCITALDSFGTGGTQETGADLGAGTFKAHQFPFISGF